MSKGNEENTFYFWKLNEKQFNLLSIILISVIGFIIYSVILDNSIHFDDELWSMNNAFKDFDLGKIFSLQPMRFVTFFTISLNYTLFGDSYWIFYLFNIAIHIFSSILVYQLIKVLFETPGLRNQKVSEYRLFLAFFGALIFLSHPIQTQAVSYIYQRLASLTALLYLATVFFYIKARLTPKSKKQIFLFILTVLFAFLALFSKENSITLPFAIILIELFFLSETIKGKWIASIIGIALLFIYLGLYFFLLGNMQIKQFGEFIPKFVYYYTGETITPEIYFLTQPRVIIYYFQLLIIPFNQNIDPEFTLSKTFFEFSTVISFIINAVIIAVAFLFIKKNKLISFGIFWFYLTLAIESSFIPIPDVMFEHRLYLPMFGIALFFIGIISYFINRKTLATVFAFVMALMLCLSVLTVIRNGVWQDEFSLWSDAASKSPHKPRVLNNLGKAYFNIANENMKQEKDSATFANMQLAERYFTNAILNDPHFKDAYTNRGTVNTLLYILTSNKYYLFSALSDYNNILDTVRYKKDSEIFAKRGNVFYLLKNYPLAIKDYEIAIKLKPDNPDLYVFKGEALLANGDLHNSEKDFDRAVEIARKENWEIKGKVSHNYYNIALHYYKQKDYVKALELFDKAIKNESGRHEFYHDKGVTYFALNNFEKALIEFDKALSINPRFLKAYNSKAAAYDQMGKFDKEIETYQKLLALQPKDFLANFYIGRAYEKMQNKDSAIFYYKRAINLKPDFKEAQEAINRLTK